MSLVRKLNFSLDPPLTPYNPAGVSKLVYTEPAHELTLYLKSNLLVFSLARIVIGLPCLAWYHKARKRLSGFPNPTEMSLVWKLNFCLDLPLTPYNPAEASKWVYSEPANELTFMCISKPLDNYYSPKT